MPFDNIFYINTASINQATITSLTASNIIAGTSLNATSASFASSSISASYSLSSSYAGTASLLLGSVSSATSASYALTASYYKMFPNIKSGQVATQSFGGIPLTASVTFATSYPISYSISIIGGDNRAWTAEFVSASNFVISSNSNQPLTSLVYWTTMGQGESS